MSGPCKTYLLHEANKLRKEKQEQLSQLRSTLRHAIEAAREREGQKAAKVPVLCICGVSPNCCTVRNAIFFYSCKSCGRTTATHSSVYDAADDWNDMETQGKLDKALIEAGKILGVE